MRRWIILLLIIGSVLLADQASKRIVIDTMRIGETRQPVPALSPFFQITRSENTGSAFGFLPQAGLVFLIIAIIVVVAMILFYPRVPDRAVLTQAAIGLVMGGALGNALDRVQHGAVIDFIHYQLPGVVSNVSNVADHAIVIGVFLIFLDSWRSDRARRQEALETEDAS